jgi:hypothetical protein
MEWRVGHSIFAIFDNQSRRSSLFSRVSHRTHVTDQFVVKYRGYRPQDRSDISFSLALGFERSHTMFVCCAKFIIQSDSVYASFNVNTLSLFPICSVVLHLCKISGFTDDFNLLRHSVSNTFRSQSFCRDLFVSSMCLSIR